MYIGYYAVYTYIGYYAVYTYIGYYAVVRSISIILYNDMTVLWSSETD